MAQMMHLFESGYDYQIIEQKLIAELEEYSEEFRIVSKENELISKYYEPCSEFDDNVRYCTSTEIMMRIEAISGLRNLNKDTLGKSLKRLGFEQKRFRHNKVLGRYWLVKFDELKNVINY
jgi:hypothetical protein